MPYREEIFIVRDTDMRKTYIERNKYFTLRLGGKKTRAKNFQKTPEWMNEVNQRRKEKKLFRIILTNFKRDDIYLTLTHEEAVDVKTAKEELKKFIRKLRNYYKKNGWELKYIYRTEYRGHRPHHHMIINDPEDGSMKRGEIQKLWKCGMITHYNFQRYDGKPEDAKRLSAYFCKESKKEIQMQIEKQAWHPSRNLKKPEVHVRTIQSKKWREKPMIPAGMELVEVVNTYTNFGYPMQIASFRKRGRQKDDTY